MALAPSNGIDIWHETFGDPEDPPLLLVMGLGAQAIHWRDDFCHGLVDRGFHVIRFDNRDAGLSSLMDGDVDLLATMAAMADGAEVEAPYGLRDMAGDAVGLLDHLGIERAHIVGASMGGMIAQTIAIEHPGRVLSLTSIFSNTGEPDYGQPTDEAMGMLLRPVAETREQIIDGDVAASKLISSPEAWEEDEARIMATAAHDRSYRPQGTARQMLAIVTSGSRADALAELDVPTLVFHGTADPLIQPSGGERTAELIPGAELIVIEGMGHDLPPNQWGMIIERITQQAAAAASA